MESISATLLQPLGSSFGPEPLSQVETTTGHDANQAAKQFESLFVAMLLKEMRQTTGEEGGLFQGDSSDIYGGLFDLFMAQHIASGPGLGIAELMKQDFAPHKSLLKDGG